MQLDSRIVEHQQVCLRFLDNTDDRPQNTCVSSDNLDCFSLGEVMRYSFFLKVMLFFCKKKKKLKALGTQSVPSQPSQPK